MTAETYIYAILATVLGMLVVFLFLSFLSFLMNLLKMLFQPPKTKEKEEDERPIEEKRRSEWVLAAVTAYMTVQEKEIYHHTAGVWKSDPMLGADPWLTGGKLSGGKTGE